MQDLCLDQRPIIIRGRQKSNLADRQPKMHSVKNLIATDRQLGPNRELDATKHTGLLSNKPEILQHLAVKSKSQAEL
jgi:hypothetical protein